MTTTPADPTVAPLVPPAADAFLAAVASGRFAADLYAPDADLDAVVPGWRFRLHGADAIAAEYGRWFADPGTLSEVCRHPVPGGAVVKYTRHWEEGGVEHGLRHVHVLGVGPDGRVASDHVWCGGRWPAPLLAEMAGGTGAD